MHLLSIINKLIRADPYELTNQTPTRPNAVLSKRESRRHNKTNDMKKIEREKIIPTITMRRRTQHAKRGMKERKRRRESGRRSRG